MPGGYGAGHEGGSMGYVTAFFEIPDLGAEMTVFTNVGNGDAAAIVNELAKVMEARSSLHAASRDRPGLAE